MSVTMSMPFVKHEDYPLNEVDCETCSICTDCVFDKEKKTAFRLPCEHVYHFECIDAYKVFNPSATCPICRRSFTTNDLNGAHPDIHALTALLDGNSRVTVDWIRKNRHLFLHHDLLQNAYEKLVEEGNLSARKITVVEADLRKYGLLERAYGKMIEGPLDVWDIELVEAGLREYGLLERAYEQLIEESELRRRDIAHVEAGLRECGLLKRAYEKLIGGSELSVSNIKEVEAGFREYGLLERAYEKLIETRGLNVYSIEQVEAGFREHGLLKRAYEKLLEGGPLRGVYIKEVSAGLRECGLLKRAYEMLIESGNLTVWKIKEVEAGLREYGLLERAWRAPEVLEAERRLNLPPRVRSFGTGLQGS
eukprot:gene9914-11740_t